MIDKFAILPILACVFALIAAPILLFLSDPYTLERAIHLAEARPENRIFWPVIAMISVILAVQNRSRLTLPPNIICLFAYLAFAGASVLWAFSPERSLVRYIQQIMVITSIVLPTLLAKRTVDIMFGIFICFSLALIFNLYFVFGGSVTIVKYGASFVNIGYQGYFEGKNYLGECAAVAFLLSLYELGQRGWRRALGGVIIVLSVFLVWLSDSKTAFALALVCPLLAWLTLITRKVTRISAAIILLSMPLSYTLLSSVSHYSIIDRLSYELYHDSTLTGRTVIWDFAQSEIDRRPLVGWGYQSFWLVPDSPASEAPGWVKMMPNAHNGYVDATLELGYVGLAFLVVFIIATLHAIGRVADHDRSRARLLLSLALFVILYNFFESLWVRGFEFLWVVFVIVAAEIGRYWRPLAARTAGSRTRRGDSVVRSTAMRAPQQCAGLS